MKKRKVCIIGRIAPGVELFDGQTIKTRVLYDELISKTNWKVFVVDTYNKKRKIRLFLKSIFLLFRCRDVFVSLSSGGLSTYFKMLRFFIFFRRTRVYHYIIGGSHHLFLKKHPKFIKTSKKFMVNWAETNNLVNELRKIGIENARYMPNFKPLTPIDISKVNRFIAPPYNFVIFSRVNESKGVGVAIETINRINKEYNNICKLDIYGVVEDSYEEKFYSLIKDNQNVRYLGTRKPFESAEILKDYFALLFPTKWEGEGFAATLLDALFAGIPVIATDWNCNSEIIEDGKTGFIYPNKHFEDLYDCVKYAVENHDAINAMKQNCIDAAKEFEPDKYIQEIISFVESK